MELKLLNEQGQAAANVAAPDTIFGRDYNEALIHQVVVAYQANARSGNRKQKDREEVHTQPRNLGVKKVLVVRVLVCLLLLCGVAVVVYSRIAG
jgi:ribosomal protein L4